MPISIISGVVMKNNYLFDRKLMNGKQEIFRVLIEPKIDNYYGLGPVRNGLEVRVYLEKLLHRSEFYEIHNKDNEKAFDEAYSDALEILLKFVTNYANLTQVRNSIL